MALLCAAASVHAARVTTTITGTIIEGGSDLAGTFVTPYFYGNLGNLPYTIVYEMDDTKGVPIYGT